MEAEPTKTEPTKRTRRWCSLRWLTWLAVVVVGAAIARCQFVEHIDTIAGSASIFLKRSYFGWPMAHVKQLETDSRPWIARPPEYEYTWYLPSLAVNSGFWLLVVSSVVLAVEGWLRKPKRRQFTLRGLALLFAATGVVLTALKQQEFIDDWLSRLGLTPGLSLSVPIGFDWVGASIVVIQFGLVCVVYLFARLVIGVVARLFARVKPFSMLAEGRDCAERHAALIIKREKAVGTLPDSPCDSAEPAPI